MLRQIKKPKNKEVTKMFKQNIKKIIVLSLSLVMGLNSTVFALSTPDYKEVMQPAKKIQECKHKVFHGDREFNKLAKQLGLTEQEFTEAESSGKSLFDLAKTKEYTPEQVRNMLIENKTEAINKAVADGKLTRDDGDKLIKDTREKVRKWDGTIKPHNPKYRNGNFEDLSSIKELKLTKEDIEAGRKSGKTLFEIAKEKNGMTPEQVKSILIRAKTDDINKKVEEGKLTREKADTIISKMKLTIERWDGIFDSKEPMS
jgi:lipoate-protein ligase A